MKLLQESPVEFLEPLSKPPETVYITQVSGKLGNVVLAGTSSGILRVRLDFTLEQVAKQLRTLWNVDIIRNEAPFRTTVADMSAYLDGSPVHIRATIQPLLVKPFTLSVHKHLTRISYGNAQTYGEIAEALCNPGAARAVGGACGRNMSLIIVPCHRVVAASGLGGFGAGLNVKKRLLRHENIPFRKDKIGTSK